MTTTIETLTQRRRSRHPARRQVARQESLCRRAFPPPRPRPQVGPPLRLSVYDRLSKRHPARAHQQWALWTARRGGRLVGRIGACIDSLFNERQAEPWAWVGFFDCVDDKATAGRLFDVALDWAARNGAKVAVGPAISRPTTRSGSSSRASVPRRRFSRWKTRLITSNSG